MFNGMSRGWLVGGVWLATLAVIIAVSAAMGATLSTSLFLLAIGAAPAVVMVLVGFGRPPQTVAEILYAVNSKDAR